MSDYSVALWSFNLGCAPESVAGLAERIEEGVRRAADGGARLLMLPEYLVECCLAFKPDGLPPEEEMGFLATVGAELISLLRPLPQTYGVSLLAGSMPVSTEEGMTNTAVLLTADGREIRQDKLCLTPFEQSPDTWHLTPGSTLRVFDLDGLKMAILICLDVEMPALSSLLAGHSLDLLLVPSMTEKPSGYHRVFGCARARAVELMCAVGVCGVVGTSKGTTQNDTNFSGAALYLPCEEEFGHTGVAADVPPTGGAAGEEPFLIAPVPFEQMRALRSGKAEVWPGAWTADHVAVTAEPDRKY
ncbi:nitrilase-related carbon-nitrogen hydrolase [Labrenzia sp. 011]|uniref:nitrilase-related carbon-nitrogen hydrolase n=1 Tax=Labrenzia sp. 011 TaxID=2171494 RepID=UPI000D51C0FE|nr:nitrilase-related carbon-nitrogen hydrolase [Labrenzia sp. 011]PVB63551.1 nitrilase [Labrenzia sp. 011]